MTHMLVRPRGHEGRKGQSLVAPGSVRALRFLMALPNKSRAVTTGRSSLAVLSQQAVCSPDLLGKAAFLLNTCPRKRFRLEAAIFGKIFRADRSGVGESFAAGGCPF